MKAFIVVITHLKGHKLLANVGNKLHCVATKDRSKAEEIAKKWNGEVFSILVDDNLRLVSRNADTIVYNEARRIGAI